MIRSYRICLFLLALTLILSLCSVYGETMSIPIAGSNEEISSFDSNNTQYLSLSELADRLDSRLDWGVVGQEVTFADPGLAFTLVINSPYFRFRDSLYNMVYPAVMREGQLFVPAETFLPFMQQATPKLAAWTARTRPGRNDSRGSSTSDRSASVKDITFSPRANGLLIQIALSDELSYDAFITTGNWLNISIRNGKLDQDRILSRKDDRLMYDLKTYQEGATGQISVRLRTDVKNWTHKFVNDPPRIQISIADTKFRIDSATAAATIGKPRPGIGPDNKIDVIVVDAGHGGVDYGAIGPNGAREKDVVLAIAKELTRQLKKQDGLEVIMTRDNDKYIPLPERAEIANRAKADLFVSIHANANPKKSVKGWNVFFLAPAKNDSARAVEQLENSYYLREAAAESEQDAGSPDAVVSILNEMIMTEFQAESHDFALMIDKELRRALDTPARGVDQAGFVVLNKVFTPSVLVETAFISNPQEEKLLRDKTYQAQVAAAITKAILQFKDKFESQ